MNISSSPTYYEVISKMAMDGNPNASLQAVLSSIVENVKTAMRVKGCSLALLTPDRKYLRHMASCGLSESYITKGRINADKSIAETPKGEFVAILDVAQDDRVQYPAEAKSEGIVSIFAVPLYLEEECMGVIRIYTANRRRFTADDIYFAHTAANIGAKAIESAVLVTDDPTVANYDNFRQQLVELEWARWPGAHCP